MTGNLSFVTLPARSQDADSGLVVRRIVKKTSFKLERDCVRKPVAATARYMLSIHLWSPRRYFLPQNLIYRQIRYQKHSFSSFAHSGPRDRTSGEVLRECVE